MFCVKGLLGEHKKNYQITSVPCVLSLLWYQQVLWSSSWIVVVKRAGAVGNQPSGVNSIPWEIRMLGKAEGWAAAYGFTISRAQAVGRPGLFSRPHTAWATMAWLAASGQAFHITTYYRKAMTGLNNMPTHPTCCLAPLDVVLQRPALLYQPWTHQIASTACLTAFTSQHIETQRVSTTWASIASKPPRTRL